MTGKAVPIPSQWIATDENEIDIWYVAQVIESDVFMVKIELQDIQGNRTEDISTTSFNEKVFSGFIKLYDSEEQAKSFVDTKETCTSCNQKEWSCEC